MPVWHSPIKTALGYAVIINYGEANCMSAFSQSLHQAYRNAKPIVPFLLVIFALFLYFAIRYTISFNAAISDCLNSRVFLIDTWDKRIYEDQLIAFEMNVVNEFYDIGDIWVKKVAAYGAQEVLVSTELVSTQANSFVLSADYVLSKLKRTPDTLQKSWRLEDDQLFMIGETLTSLDSRFWGPINKKDVRGRAYAIF